MTPYSGWRVTRDHSDCWTLIRLGYYQPIYHLPNHMKEITVGRSSQCTLQCPAEDISRKHFRLVRCTGLVDGRVYWNIKDPGSSMGTYLNQRRIEASENFCLMPGDLIGVGTAATVAEATEQKYTFLYRVFAPSSWGEGVDHIIKTDIPPRKRKLEQNNVRQVNVTPKGNEVSYNLHPSDPYTVRVIGTDKAMYTLEIFMRDVKRCCSKRDLARRTDQRVPIIHDHQNQAHAIIPADHKLLLYAKRIATNTKQTLKNKKYVLFEFQVDGTALSEGELCETSISNPNVHWAKAHIKTTQSVLDNQTVEHSIEANPLIGSFQIHVWTQLCQAKVTGEWQAMPQDDKSHEKRKQRICIADSDSGGITDFKRFKKPVVGLSGLGPPQATIRVNYDDLIGTRSRHLGEKEFSITRLGQAGVTEAMLREVYPQVYETQEPISISDDSDVDEK